MSRTLPTDYAAETEAPIFRPAFFVYLDWPSGAVRAWTGYGTISWGGHDWTGVGHLGSISPIGENTDLRANGLTLTLNGIPSELIADVLANDSQGRTAKVWLAPMTSAGALAADPYLLKDAVIDVCPFTDEGATASISVKIENELIDRRQKVRRRTHEDQQLVLAGDMYYEYVAGLADKQITWGGKTVSGSARTAGSVEAITPNQNYAE